MNPQHLLEGLGLASMLFVAVFTVTAYGAHPGEGQSPRSAVIEAWLNIAIGFSINFVMNLLVIPLAMDGQPMSLLNNWWMGWVYTSVAIVRQFAIRRWFNARLVARILAGERK